jgi:hypothetical protein
MRCLSTEMSEAGQQRAGVVAVISCDSTCDSDASIGDVECQTTDQVPRAVLAGRIATS